MIYAVMIALDSGVFKQDNYREGPVSDRVRNQVLSMIQQTLLSCEDLGGPKAHRLDFRRFHATVERLNPDKGHVDRVVIKPDGIFAKIEIPPQDGEINWNGLSVVTDND